MVLGELGFRANRTTRAHQRTTKFLNQGAPLRSPPPPLPPTSTRYEMRAHAFYELVKLCVFFIYAGPKDVAQTIRDRLKNCRAI